MRFVCSLCLLALLGCKPAARMTPAPGREVVRLIHGEPRYRYPLAQTNGVTTLQVQSRQELLKRKLRDDEALWGFGERFEAFNMRGRVVESFLRDMAQGGPESSYFAVPFFISSAGYGLFVNCSGRVRFDCGASRPDELRIEVPEPGVELFLFKGTPREILAEYTRLLGRPQPVPDWVFAPWISRNSYLSAYDVDRVIEKMEEHGLKAGAVVLEAWAESLQNFRFEQSRYPDPEAWIEKLHKRGYRVVLWETPSLWDSASTYAEAKQNGYLVLNPDGTELRLDWLENAVKVDFRNPAARAWWRRLHEPLLAMGVAGFKTDGGERHPDPWFHNLHPYHYQRAVLEAFAPPGQNDATPVAQSRQPVAVVFARSASAPCAGHSVFWAGDQHADWRELPRLLRAGLSAALCGFPYWGHDIGGYSGTPTKKLYIRWLELGAFTPIMQFHGVTPREPYYYDEETVRIAKYYFDLRRRLMPEILSWARAAREMGVPMWRPLLYEFPDERATWSVEDEFLFGPDLLVAPLLSEDDERPVYLPAGEWVDVWTGVRHTGPKRLTARASLAQIPVFARNGAEKFFTPLPADPRAEVYVELAGPTNERGIVPAQRILRGQKYEKIFLTVHNRTTNDVAGELVLGLPQHFTALPDVRQSFKAKAGSAARLAFYVSWPHELPVGSYPVKVTGVGDSPLRVTLVMPPGQWLVLGPFEGGVGMRFEGELPLDFGAEYKAAGGRTLRWKPVPEDCMYADGYVDFARALGAENGPTTFGATVFVSPAGGPARLWAGSGDALTIWLNGELVFDKQVHRSAERDEDAVGVTLRPGENTVLVKISRGIGPNGLYFRVE